MGTRAHWFQGPYRWAEINGPWSYAPLLSEVREDVEEAEVDLARVEKFKVVSGETVLVWAKWLVRDAKGYLRLTQTPPTTTDEEQP